MTKNGPIPKTTTVLESQECTDHFGSMKKILNSQSPFKNHPNIMCTNHAKHNQTDNLRGCAICMLLIREIDWVRATADGVFALMNSSPVTAWAELCYQKVLVLARIRISNL